MNQHMILICSIWLWFIFLFFVVFKHRAVQKNYFKQFISQKCFIWLQFWQPCLPTVLNVGVGHWQRPSLLIPSAFLPAGSVLCSTFARLHLPDMKLRRFPWEQDECLPLARDWNKSTRATANKRGCRVSFVGLFCSFLDNWGKMKLDNQSGKIKEDTKKSGASKFVTIWK